MKFELNATKRTLQGSGASRRLRRADKVPAVVYGGGSDPVAIEVGHNDLLLSLRKEAFHSSVITLKVDGKTETVLLRDAQMHAYKPIVLHADFMRVDSTHVIHQKVPFHFINAELSPGVKIAGGMVSHALNEIEVSCLPQDLPAFIEVDLQHMKAGQTLLVSQINFPKGVAAVTHGTDDPLVVSIVVKKAAEGTEEGDAAKAGA